MKGLLSAGPPGTTLFTTYNPVALSLLKVNPIPTSLQRDNIMRDKGDADIVLEVLVWSDDNV